jgi:hypothetical protein
MSRPRSNNPSFTQLLFCSSRLEPYFESDIANEAEKLALRRDMITLLTFVRDKKVVGTQSTGNMPLKVIRELTANFTNPPIPDTNIGNRIYKLRTEEDVWQLYFLHILGEVGGLLQTPRARQWRLTSVGKKFLQTPSLIQLWYLLMIWWHRVNWLVAYPIQGMGESLPPFFNIHTIDSLNKTPVNRRINFEEFADKLIKKAGLTWISQDTTHHAMFLRSSIKRMVIDILTSFGMAEPEYQEKPLGKGKMFELVAFKINDLGKVLLEAMIVAQFEWM